MKSPWRDECVLRAAPAKASSSSTQAFTAAAASTGSVKVTAQQLADYYETENSFAMKNLVSMIELAVTVVIMGSLVFLTLLSSETAGIDVNRVAGG